MRINLLPKEERPLKQTEVRWEFLVGILAVLVLGSVLLFTWLEKNNLSELDKLYAEGLRREANLEKQVQQIQEIRNEISSLEILASSYLELLDKEGPEIGNLPVLTRHSFPQLWLETLLWKDSTVELVGYTQNMTSLSLYLNFLNELSDNVMLQSVYPHENSGFYIFRVELEGVGANDPA